MFFRRVTLLLLLFSSKTVKTMALNLKEVSVESKPFHVPSLNEVASVLKDGLKKHFQNVDVEVVDCPNLGQKPFSLAMPGLCGDPKLVEIGSPAYLLPKVNRSKLYDLVEVAEISKTNPAFIIGAGAGPFDYLKTNCEGIYNIVIKDGKVAEQSTKISKIDPKNKSVPIQETLPKSVQNVALLANFFLSEGKPGKVLKVHVTKRLSNNDFIAAIRTVLAEHFGTGKPVGLGGTFLMKEGKAKTHVMPDFSETPLNNETDLNNWLQFFNMSAPLISVGTLATTEYDDLDLRVQHFHLFSDHGEAGHYHIDTTPDVVEYLGYFNIAQSIVRIDKPTSAMTFGKD